MSQEIIHISVTGAYGETNFGDDLLMLVFENYFSSNFENIVLDFEGQKSDYPSSLLTIGSYMKDDFVSDLIVYGGGTQFFSFSAQKLKTPLQKLSYYLFNPKKIISKFFDFKNNYKKEKHSFNVKKCFLGFGLGPFHNNQQSIDYAKHRLQEAAFVGVRDKASLGYCNDWGIESCFGADVVFSSYFNVPQTIIHQQQADKSIGIIVRDWAWEASGAAYLEKLKEFASTCGDRKVRFIVFAPLKDQQCLSIFDGYDVLIWDPIAFTVNNFISELNNFSVFISARYHGAIIGAILGKPIICVEVEPKLRLLSEQLIGSLLWEKPFELTQLNSLIDSIDYNHDYSDSLADLKLKADNMLDSFKRYVENV